MAVDDCFAKRAGYQRDELLAQTIFCLFQPEDLTEVFNIFRMFLACTRAKLDRTDLALSGLAKGDVFGVRKRILLVFHLCCANKQTGHLPTHISVFCLKQQSVPLTLHSDDPVEPL